MSGQQVIYLITLNPDQCGKRSKEKRLTITDDQGVIYTGIPKY